MQNSQFTLSMDIIIVYIIYIDLVLIGFICSLYVWGHERVEFSHKLPKTMVRIFSNASLREIPLIFL